MGVRRRGIARPAHDACSRATRQPVVMGAHDMLARAPHGSGRHRGVTCCFAKREKHARPGSVAPSLRRTRCHGRRGRRRRRRRCPVASVRHSAPQVRARRARGIPAGGTRPPMYPLRARWDGHANTGWPAVRLSSTALAVARTRQTDDSRAYVHLHTAHAAGPPHGPIIETPTLCSRLTQRALHVRVTAVAAEDEALALRERHADAERYARAGSASPASLAPWRRCALSPPKVIVRPRPSRRRDVGAALRSVVTAR